MDRVYIVRNKRTGEYLQHGGSRIAIFWNPKMAKRAANTQSKRPRKAFIGDSQIPTQVYDVFEVLELDPNFGFVIDSTESF